MHIVSHRLQHYTNKQNNQFTCDLLFSLFNSYLYEELRFIECVYVCLCSGKPACSQAESLQTEAASNTAAGLAADLIVVASFMFVSALVWNAIRIPQAQDSPSFLHIPS
jgi:hypothetical protein